MVLLLPQLLLLLAKAQIFTLKPEKRAFGAELAITCILAGSLSPTNKPTWKSRTGIIKLLTKNVERHWYPNALFFDKVLSSCVG